MEREGQIQMERVGKMKLVLKSVVLSGLVMLVGMPTAKASTVFGDYLEDSGIEVSVSASLDYVSEYIWRGFKLDGDASLQPGFEISANGLSVGFWGSWDLESNDALASDEVDAYIGYSFDMDIVNVNFGYTYYGFPESDLYSHEFWLGVGLDTFLSPSIVWYEDVGDEAQGGADGSVIELSIAHSLTMEDLPFSLDLGAAVGFNHEAFIAGDGGYTLLSVAVPIALTDTVTLTPSVNWSSPFGDLADASDGNQEDNLYTGISLAFSM